MSATKATIDWRGEEYMRAARNATMDAWREASKLIARSARANAPRSREHRVERTYPGGRKFSDPKRISQSIRPKVKDRGDRGILAYVKVHKAGYAVFPEHGHEIRTRGGRVVGKVGPRYFMRRALTENLSRVMGILTRRWPK